KLLVAAAKAKAGGRRLSDLVKNLGAPAESQEFRLKIKGEEDFRAYGNGVLKTFEERAVQAGIKVAKPSYEGVRLVFPDGWALLRMSLHDPNMPLNIESREEGGVKEIAAQVKGMLDGFVSLDLSVFAE
ncbi:MAG: phosphomannomutase/phosphoglucomutase, partial [Selenomonas sp.]|nr:phosphomannomutase/phosphoglucomutase [Selenomonas sp.]